MKTRQINLTCYRDAWCHPRDAPGLVQVLRARRLQKLQPQALLPDLGKDWEVGSVELAIWKPVQKLSRWIRQELALKHRLVSSWLELNSWKWLKEGSFRTVQRKFKVHWSKVLEGWLRILSSKSVECEQRRCRVRSGNWNSSARFFFFLFFFMRKGRETFNLMTWLLRAWRVWHLFSVVKTTRRHHYLGAGVKYGVNFTHLLDHFTASILNIYRIPIPTTNGTLQNRTFPNLLNSKDPNKTYLNIYHFL